MSLWSRFTHDNLNLMPADNTTGKIFSAKVAGLKNLSPDIVEITFSTDKPFEFKAGQYVWVELPDLIYPDPRGGRRAFSITSEPDGNTIQTIFKRSESGFKRSLMELKPEDPVKIHGPFGSFLTEGLKSSEPLILIAGGLAIAPYLSLVRQFTTKKIDRKIFLLNAIKSQEEDIYKDEFSLLESNNPGFKYMPYFDHINNKNISDIKNENPDAYWYITGPQGFVDAIWTLFKKNNIDPGRVGFEEHYPIEGIPNLTVEELSTETSSIFRLALDKAFLHMIITDVNGKVIYANEMAQKITGYSLSEMLGSTPRLWGGMMDHDFYKELWNTKKVRKESFTGNITNRRKNGEIYIAQITVSPIINSEGNLIGFIGTEEDITNSEHAREDLKRFNKLMVDREIKMIELKKEIEELRKQR